jgi:hypothetical protein
MLEGNLMQFLLSNVCSTFWPFKCANCEAPLGKVYKTTASHLDFIRDYFTFDTDAIVS